MNSRTETDDLSIEKSSNTIQTQALEHFDNQQKFQKAYSTYWQKKVNDFAPLILPFSIGQAVDFKESDLKTFNIPVSKAAKDFIEKNYINESGNVVVSAFLIYLMRISGETSFGVSLSSKKMMESIISMPTNEIINLPFNVTLDPELPFDDVVKKVGTEFSEITANLLSTNIATSEISSLIAIRKVNSNTAYPSINSNALTLVVEDEMQWGLEYNSKIWEQEEVESIGKTMSTIIDNIASNVEYPIKNLSLLSEEERHKILYAWNDTKIPYAKEKVIHQFIEERASATPNEVALVFNDSIITYQELNERANQLAHYLRKNGIREEVMVGISIDRSPEMIIAMLGILKSGGVYVPLDRNYPLERLQYMVEVTEAPYIVTLEKWTNEVPTPTKGLILLDIQADEISLESKENLPVISQPENLACVLFTSGSTGKPKGVGIKIQGVVRTIQGANYAELNNETVMMCFSTIAFDVSLFEIWGCLTNGGKLVLVPYKHPTITQLT